MMFRWRTASFLSALSACVICLNVLAVEGQRVFDIDYVSDTFRKDGKPFRVMSGSLHYFRVPHPYWKDRLIKMRAAGLNTVATYVEWSSHEPEIGQYNFEGDNDILNFIRLANETGLLVSLRVGPYICAERDMGGFPPWLLTEKKHIALRTSDEVFKYHSKRWLDKFMPMVFPYLYGNGGPIIMVQVENEYGSYHACDLSYGEWLSNIFRDHVGDKALLYTTDGAGKNFLRCGKIRNVFATVDFGPHLNVSQRFATQRLVQPHGPFVNSEYYPGWLSWWGEPLNTVNITDVARTLNDMLRIPGASFNIYIFVGGTNFGFKSGANDPFKPQLTSYDYDAPLTEAGDPTYKYYAIREVIGMYTQLPPLPVPVVSPKMAFGSIHLSRVFNMRVLANRPVTKSRVPLSFEELRNHYGFVMYETELPDKPVAGANITVHGLADRGILFLNKERFATLCRTADVYWATLPQHAQPNSRLTILVENQGRLNYGNYINDSKGIREVTLDGQKLYNWTMSSFPLQNASRIHQVVQRWMSRPERDGRLSRPSVPKVRPNTNSTQFIPGVFYATFTLPEDSPEKPYDTFLDTSGWGKGVAYLNEFNLGRYWPAVGPQITLYTPGIFFRPYPQVNTLTLIELDKTPAVPTINFVDTPLLDTEPASAC